LFKDKAIGDKRLGVDWGRVEPSAFTVVGRDESNHVYVLWSEELSGRSEDAILRASQLYREHNCEMCFPDPAQSSNNEALENLGLDYAVLFSEGGQQKSEYLGNLIRHVERKIIHIPKAFETLICQLKGYAYESKRGKEKAIKRDDHSVDSLMYAISEFYDEASFPGSDFEGVKSPWQ
jgi:hypothetical protein